ncbi:MAG: hypothetical protein ACTSRZ_06120 [Promethearchaeota archaeon]
MIYNNFAFPTLIFNLMIIFLVIAYMGPLIVFFIVGIKNIIQKRDWSSFINVLIGTPFFIFAFLFELYIFFQSNISSDPNRHLLMKLFIIPLLVVWLIILFGIFLKRLFLKMHLQHLLNLKQKKKFVLDNNKNNKNNKEESQDKNILKNERRKKYILDLRRKLVHLISFLLIIFSAFAMINLFNQIYPGIPLSFTLGYNSSNPNEKFFIFQLINEENSLDYLPFGHLFFIAVLLEFGLFFIAIEASRHLTKKYYPFSKLIYPFLRENETESISTVVFFLMALMFVAIVIPPLPFISIISISAIGDLAASQTGILFGKHKLPINDSKTWEGLIAGLIISFSLSIPWIGLTWTLIATFIFVLIDFFTEKPIPVTDNLLVPLAICFAFVLLNFAGIPYIYPNFLPIN